MLRKRIASIAVSIVLVVSFCPCVAFAQTGDSLMMGGISIQSSESNSYELQDGSAKKGVNFILVGEEYLYINPVYGQENFMPLDTVQIPGLSFDEATNTLTIKNYNKTFPKSWSGPWIRVSGDVTVKIVGKNTIQRSKDTDDVACAVGTEHGSSMTVIGTGSLTTKNCGAYMSTKNLTIKGGTITCNKISYAALDVAGNLVVKTPVKLYLNGVNDGVALIRAKKTTCSYKSIKTHKGVFLGNGVEFKNNVGVFKTTSNKRLEVELLKYYGPTDYYKLRLTGTAGSSYTYHITNVKSGAFNTAKGKKLDAVFISGYVRHLHKNAFKNAKKLRMLFTSDESYPYLKSYEAKSLPSKKLEVWIQTDSKAKFYAMKKLMIKKGLKKSSHFVMQSYAGGIVIR